MCTEMSIFYSSAQAFKAPTSSIPKFHIIRNGWPFRMGYRLRPEEISQTSDERKRKGRPIENVLIMQGGGSLGACGCGVYKALVKK